MENAVSVSLLIISIPAPVWGATWAVLIAATVADFNSRPRVGGDVALDDPLLQRHISIPAPVWGATGISGLGVGHAAISIPAPVWGATANLYKNKLLQICKMT